MRNGSKRTPCKTREMAIAERLKQETIKGALASVHGITIEDAINKFLLSWSTEVTEKTLGHHTLLLERLQSFCEMRGALYMEELNVDLLEEFKGQLKGKASTRQTQVNKLRCFLKEAFRREWTTKHLAAQVKPISAPVEQKEPYTPEQVKAILQHAEEIAPNKGAGYGYASRPKTFRLLLELMAETGMRVQDAVLFDPARLIKGTHLWVYHFAPTKQKRIASKKMIDAYLGDGLKNRIDACEWMGERPFHYNGGNLVNLVYERMATIGKRAEIDDCRPHRLRDTFAVQKLLAGVSIDDVSRLLGHSSVKVTETYYLRWVKARANRLEGIVAGSLAHTS